MKPIIRWTLYLRRWSTIWWSIGIVAFLLLNLVFYPSFKNQASELQKTFENLPDAAVQLFGGSTDFFSPIGFLNSQIFFLMLPLLLSMLAVSLGAALIAREEQDMTIETLLARPISRVKLLGSKAIAGSLILLSVSLVSLITTLLSARIFDISVPLSNIALASLNCFFLAFTTGAIAFLLAATGRARGAAIGIGALVGVGGYLVSSLSGTVHWLENPSKIFPFHYYQSEAILRDTYNWSNALYFLIVTLACGVLSFVVFRRRDVG